MPDKWTSYLIHLYASTQGSHGPDLDLLPAWLVGCHPGQQRRMEPWQSFQQEGGTAHFCLCLLGQGLYLLKGRAGCSRGGLKGRGGMQVAEEGEATLFCLGGAANSQHSSGHPDLLLGGWQDPSSDAARASERGGRNTNTPMRRNRFPQSQCRKDGVGCRILEK